MLKNLWLKIKKALARLYVGSQSTAFPKDEVSVKDFAFAAVVVMLAIAAVIGCFVIAAKVSATVTTFLGFTGFFGLIFLITIWYATLSMCFGVLGSAFGYLSKWSLSGIDENLDELTEEFGAEAVKQAQSNDTFSFGASFGKDEPQTA